VRPATLPAADAERLLGKAIEHEHSLADLLRARRRTSTRLDIAVGAAGRGVST
jgi:tRNA uridine 5-carboxymethylaminomethyl modification enzyme